MAVVVVSGNRVSTVMGPAPGRGATAEFFRKTYGSSARVVLVGKDGGIKLSSRQAVSAGRLFGLIDSMPMRQDEMRRRK